MQGENHYLQLPTLEDGNSIQMALMQVMEALLRDQIDTKLAGLLLYPHFRFESEELSL